MMMPEKDGLQACRELRDGPPLKAYPSSCSPRARMRKPNSRRSARARATSCQNRFPRRNCTSASEPRGVAPVSIQTFQANQALESTIEQLKETESQLVQTEKLASLGRMSAGIIHEINNP